MGKSKLSPTLKCLKESTETYEKQVQKLSLAIDTEASSTQPHLKYTQSLQEELEFWSIVSEFSEQDWTRSE